MLGLNIIFHLICFPDLRGANSLSSCKRKTGLHREPDETNMLGKILTTVDGRNPAPVEVGSLSHYLRRVFCIPAVAGFLNHQQYGNIQPWSLQFMMLLKVSNPESLPFPSQLARYIDTL